MGSPKCREGEGGGIEKSQEGGGLPGEGGGAQRAPVRLCVVCGEFGRGGATCIFSGSELSHQVKIKR